MRHVRCLLLFPALLALGCPGDWDAPLGPVEAGRIDERLVGRWRCVGSSDPDPFLLSIVPFDKAQYVLALTDAVDSRKEPAFFHGYTTTLEGHDVMNLRELEKDGRDRGWTYARFRVLDGRLHLDLVEADALEGVPDDAESRALAIGDLFEADELWDAGPRCVSFEEPTGR